MFTSEWTCSYWMSTYLGEFVKADFAIKVFVSLNYGSVDQLLKLDIRQIVANHHLEHLEQLSIRNESIVVNVVDLESKSKFLFVTGSS